MPAVRGPSKEQRSKEITEEEEVRMNEDSGEAWRSKLKSRIHSFGTALLEKLACTYPPSRGGPNLSFPMGQGTSRLLFL